MSFGTPAATSGPSLFGSAAPAPQTPSLFGNFGKPAAGTPSLFGSTPAAPSAASSSATPATSSAGGGLFGTGTPATTSAGGGLFGSTPATSSAGGGLFGTGAATASASGGGILGSTPTITASTGGSQFTTPAQTSAPSSGGIFGSANPASQTPSLFGAAPATSTPQTGGFLGNKTLSAQPPSLFGSSQPAQNGGFLSAGSRTGGLGQTIQLNASQNTVPAATIDVSKLTPTTRFSDCHDSVKGELELIENTIQSQITLSRQLSDRFPMHREALETIPSDVSILTHRLATTTSFLAADEAGHKNVRAMHDADEQAATLSIRTLDLFRLPHAQRSQFIQRASTFTSTPQRENDITSNRPMIAYFNKQVDGFERKIGIIRRSVREIEESLKSVELQAIESSYVGTDMTAVTQGVAGRQDARRLNRTLRDFYEAMTYVSGKVVEAREALRKLEGRG